jgi:predicted nucleotide-binding protein (sugar kinase/HSP70/actin superfamily)
MTRATFIPLMSDHAHTAAAVMRGNGVPAQVLPPPDLETLNIGLDLCRGRECLPCFFCIGDIVRCCRQPGFDPATARFFLPTGGGPCRFGQYSVLVRDVLEQQGLGQAEVVSPAAEQGYKFLGENAARIRRQAWQALVAVDLLTKALHEHRPYEVEPGQADLAYRESLDKLVAACEAGAGSRLVEAMAWTARRFQEVRVDRSEPRPLIGLLGELYVMLNVQSNRDLARQVEEAGGEVLLGTLMDWVYFTDWRRKTLAVRFRRPKDLLAGWISDLYQHAQAKKLHRPLARVLRHPPELPMSQAMQLLQPHWDTMLGTEATLTMGRALDLAQNGLAGIINVLPFSCMPGTVVAGMAPRLRQALNGLPWLDLLFDGQRETNIKTRLEAFMHQASQVARQRGPGPGRKQAAL